MAGWYNNRNWDGLRYNPWTKYILRDFCAAINERFDLIGVTHGVYHTNSGNQAHPTISHFIGMPFDELDDTFDDIETGISNLISAANWYDANDLDHSFTWIGDLANRTTGFGVRPGSSVRTSFAALEWYSDIISALYILRYATTVETPDTLSRTEKDSGIEDFGNVVGNAWADMKADSGTSMSGYSSRLYVRLFQGNVSWEDGHTDTWWQWIADKNAFYRLDLTSLPSDGTIIQSEVQIRTRGHLQDVQDPQPVLGIIDHNFKIYNSSGFLITTIVGEINMTPETNTREVHHGLTNKSWVKSGQHVDLRIDGDISMGDAPFWPSYDVPGGEGEAWIILSAWPTEYDFTIDYRPELSYY